jgi:hypothetical protein
VDFFDTFAPVAKPAIIRLFFMMANCENLEIHQSDIRAAYLNADLDVEMYMRQPKGYEKYSKTGKPLYCKLLKALYGTKQAGRRWRHVIMTFLIEQQFKASVFDPCLFTRGTGNDFIAIVIWVDDLLGAYHSTNCENWGKFYEDLKARFNVNDLGEVSDYLGMVIERQREQRIFTFNNQDNIRKMLLHFNMENCSGRDTPLNSGIQITPRGANEEPSAKPYRSLIGSLLYPAQWTRPDLAYAVGALSQVMSDPADRHWKAAMETLRYVQKTQELNLVYRNNGNYDILAYADSDFAADRITGKSTYGYVVFVGGNPISWKSRKSKTVSTSTTIAELEAVYQCATECIWIQQVLESWDKATSKTFKIYCDNQSTVKVLHGEKYLDRTKHETVKVEYLRDKIRDGIMSVEWISTEDMIADVFTKSLGRVKFEKHIASMNLVQK